MESIEQPVGKRHSYKVEEGERFAERVGYPEVRPAYTLGDTQGA